MCIVAYVESGYFFTVFAAVESIYITVDSHSSGFGSILFSICPGGTYGYDLFFAPTRYFHLSTSNIGRDIEFDTVALSNRHRNVTVHIDIATAFTLFRAGKACNWGIVGIIYYFPILSSGIIAVSGKHHTVVGRRGARNGRYSPCQQPFPLRQRAEKVIKGFGCELITLTIKYHQLRILTYVERSKFI